MPLYDYFCSDCGSFREMIRIADCALDRPCPSCGRHAQRVLSAPFFADSGDTADAPAQRVPGATGSWRHMCGFGCRHCATSG
jgi:putative FmdB family regulatory protein